MLKSMVLGAKLGEIVNGSTREGAILRDRFYKQYPAYKTLRNQVLKASDRGLFMEDFDGRKLKYVQPSQVLITTPISRSINLFKVDWYS